MAPAMAGFSLSYRDPDHAAAPLVLFVCIRLAIAAFASEARPANPLVGSRPPLPKSILRESDTRVGGGPQLVKSGRVKPTDSNRISVSGDRFPPQLVRSILYLAIQGL
jgi:hypothetical protein